MKYFFRIRNKSIKQRCIELIQSLPDDGDYEIIIQPYDPKRSLEQNSLAHLIVTSVKEQVWLPDEDGGKRQYCLISFWKNFFWQMPDLFFLLNNFL